MIKHIKITITIFFVTIAILLLSPVLTAQDLKSLLEDMQKGYPDLEHLEVKMQMKVFEKQGEGTPMYADNFLIQKTGKSYRYQFGTSEMIMNENYLIMLDHQLQLITYGPRNQSDDEAANIWGSMNLDSILNLQGNIQMITRNTQSVHYRITNKGKDIEIVDVFYDLVNNHVKKLHYTYNSGHFVEIKFILFDREPKFEKALFLTTSYLNIKGDLAKAADKYKSYKISNRP